MIFITLTPLPGAAPRGVSGGDGGKLHRHRARRRLCELILLVLCVYVAGRGVGAADVGVDLHAVVRGVVDVAERRSHGGLGGGGGGGDNEGRAGRRVRGSGRKAMRLFVVKYQDSHGRHRGQRRRGRGQRRRRCIFGPRASRAASCAPRINICSPQRALYSILQAVFCVAQCFPGR
ncbi:hypothetical protein BD626DRAFT_11726 [Schizophyllum amplum]|uniref:Uncharacterized protein n=1 Tax=Schizophyllum amplum TaxID=97359 RepID=A0A550CX88_9AGAR|nr:hypothetical protein BD626DRAFT_11726 [Auriculariopsis ampla]